MAGYGPGCFRSFYLFMAQARSASAMKTRKEKKKRGSITYCTDRANEANNMFITNEASNMFITRLC